MALVENLKVSTQIKLAQKKKHQAKVPLHIEMGNYIIKTADNSEELISSFKLRHEVFNNEFRGIEGEGFDFDEFDKIFDHLIIIHKSSQQIIGTYRLNSSKFSKKSYTALEFNMPFLNNDVSYLELGRACIHKDFRKGAVISLLWRGIAQYMKLSGADLLIGCSSVKVNHPREASLLYKYLLDAGHISEFFHSSPTPNFAMENFESWYNTHRLDIDAQKKQEAQDLLPSLLRSYIKLGAKISGEPAFDRDFDCIDFLTVLRKEDLSKLLADKFQV